MSKLASLSLLADTVRIYFIGGHDCDQIRTVAEEGLEFVVFTRRKGISSSCSASVRTVARSSREGVRARRRSAGNTCLVAKHARWNVSPSRAMGHRLAARGECHFGLA
jgi:hypothetical protein